MRWVVAAPFITEPTESGWLTPFVNDPRHTFSFVPFPRRSPDWHHRSSRATRLKEWQRYWSQSGDALRSAHDGGVITVFPQLAAVVGLRQRLARLDLPVVAWAFNLGMLYTGIRGQLARFALRRIARFAVHSRGEIEQYSQWLGLPMERFEFVPLQRAPIPIEHEEETGHPFVLAMGSAARDYRTFFEAIERVKVPAVVVAAAHAVSGLRVPDNVTLLGSLTRGECHALAQKARINVVPVANQETASGQVTVVEAMTQGRAVIATRCMGTVDYVQDGQTGILVEPGSVDALAGAIRRLWEDEALRRRLNAEARAYAISHFSDEGAGHALARILNAVSDESTQVS